MGVPWRHEVPQAHAVQWNCRSMHNLPCTRLAFSASLKPQRKRRLRRLSPHVPQHLDNTVCPPPGDLACLALFFLRTRRTGDRSEPRACMPRRDHFLTPEDVHKAILGQNQGQQKFDTRPLQNQRCQVKFCLGPDFGELPRASSKKWCFKGQGQVT